MHYLILRTKIGFLALMRWFFILNSVVPSDVTNEPLSLQSGMNQKNRPPHQLRKSIDFKLVPEAGLEPARPYDQRILSP